MSEINERNWRDYAQCKEEDPELFFPIGSSGPALLQTEQAKAVCRRCIVTDACLNWALESGQDAGIWGGMSEDERRAIKRRGGLRVGSVAIDATVA
jgi:WhiB family transcriptional regulator, redox-sensing transcriptional regulator